MKKVKEIFQTVIKFLNNYIAEPVKKAYSYVKKNAIDPIVKYWKKIPNKYRRQITGLLFIAPWIFGFFFFQLDGIITSIKIAMAEKATYEISADKLTIFTIKLYPLKDFYGNFTKILNEPDHLEVIMGFIKDIALIVPLVLVFALILALMLNQKIKGRGIFRMIFFIPVILLSGNMLSYFMQYDLLTVPAITNGQLVEQMSEIFHPALAEVISLAFSKLVLILWLSGVQTLIFLAGLTKIDRSVYEAASVDGASKWESFWKITLPALIPLMILNVVYTTVVYSNLSSNEIINLITVTQGQVKFQRPYASALSWVLFIIDLLIIGVYSLFIKIASKKYN